MIDLDQAELDRLITVFDNERVANRINPSVPQLPSSTGRAIDGFNNCMRAFDDYCANINRLYTVTSKYLHKVSDNIEECEESNTRI